MVTYSGQPVGETVKLSHLFFDLVSISVVARLGRIACSIPDRNGSMELLASWRNCKIDQPFLRFSFYLCSGQTW